MPGTPLSVAARIRVVPTGTSTGWGLPSWETKFTRGMSGPPGSAQGRDVAVAAAQFAQDGLAVLADGGNAVHAVLEGVVRARRQQRGKLACRRDYRAEALAREQLRMVPQVAHFVHACVGDLRFFQAGDHLFGGQLA